MQKWQECADYSGRWRRGQKVSCVKGWRVKVRVKCAPRLYFPPFISSCCFAPCRLIFGCIRGKFPSMLHVSESLQADWQAVLSCRGNKKKKKKRKRKGKPPERDGDHSLASLLQKLRMWSSNCLLISQGKLNKCAGGTINLYFLKMGAEILVFGPHRAPHESRRYAAVVSAHWWLPGARRPGGWRRRWRRWRRGWQIKKKERERDRAGGEKEKTGGKKVCTRGGTGLELAVLLSVTIWHRARRVPGMQARSTAKFLEGGGGGRGGRWRGEVCVCQSDRGNERLRVSPRGGGVFFLFFIFLWPDLIWMKTPQKRRLAEWRRIWAADLMGARCPDAASCLPVWCLQTRCHRGERDDVLVSFCTKWSWLRASELKPTWLQTEPGVCFTSWHQTHPLKVRRLRAAPPV